MLWPKTAQDIFLFTVWTSPSHCINLSFTTKHEQCNTGECPDQLWKWKWKDRLPQEKSYKHEKVFNSLRNPITCHLSQRRVYDPLQTYRFALFLSKYSEVLVNSCLLSTKWQLLHLWQLTAPTLSTFQSFNRHENNCNRMLNGFSHGLRTSAEALLLSVMRSKPVE